VGNLTSYSSSATPISYKNDEISPVPHIVFEIPNLGYLGVRGYFWGGGYLTSSGARCNDVIFLLGDPDFLQRRQNFVPILHSFRDQTRDRHDRQMTDDRHSDQNRRISHCKCASLIN